MQEKPGCGEYSTWAVVRPSSSAWMPRVAIAASTPLRPITLFSRALVTSLWSSCFALQGPQVVGY